MNEKTQTARKKVTTIAIHANTKDKLDRIRAPGQCYDGFICQLMDFWERKNPQT